MTFGVVTLGFLVTGALIAGVFLVGEVGALVVGESVGGALVVVVGIGGAVLVVAAGGVAGGVALGGVLEAPSEAFFSTSCGCLRAGVALALLLIVPPWLLATLLITLVSWLATPDELETEAFFDGMGFCEMDDRVPKNDPIETLSGLEVAPLDAFGRGVGLGETTRGAATAQTTSARAATPTKLARARNSDRLPQTGLILSILIPERTCDYSSFEGGHDQ